MLAIRTVLRPRQQPRTRTPATLGLRGPGGGATATGTNPGTTGTPTPGTSDTGGALGSTGTNPTTSGQVLGGGPVLGVVSKQAAEGIHSFGEKKKYNEWFFIYDPSQDKGQLLVGPYNPKMFLGAANAGLGNPPSPGTGPGAGGATTPGPGSSNPPSTPAPSAPMSPTPMQ